MRLRPPRSTRTATLLPDPTLCRSGASGRRRPIRRRDADDESRAGVGLFHLDGAAVNANDLPHDRQPQPGASGAAAAGVVEPGEAFRSEEHTSGLQSLMRISYAVFCLQKKKRRVAL